MCGITGIYNYSGRQGVVSPDLIDSMTRVIEHRGPDDSGTYLDESGKIAMGFRRLSIIDLSLAGHQPMSAAEGTVWITFNGEIYNHAEIRERLERKGYTYRSKTDTETILYAYLEYGIDCIKEFIGMFAIAIWDGRDDSLYLIRDRLGIKPLYFTATDGAVYYGSEIKSILSHPDVPRRLDHQSFYDYLSFYITPPGRTLFDGIEKLEAGHVLRIDSSGGISKRRYWDALAEREKRGVVRADQREECESEILSLLRDSVQYRMIADVPFGVLLSGGVDSSLNVALMSELMDRPVETFSAGFVNMGIGNEFRYARQIAQQFGTNHHETEISESDVARSLPEMVVHQDEPNADPACVPMYFVSKLARENGTTVVQVGEGADELFSGYAHYLRELRFQKYYYNLPRMIHRVAGPLATALFKSDQVREYAWLAREQVTPFFYGAVPAFGELSKRELLSHAFRNNLSSSDRVSRHFLHELDNRTITPSLSSLERMTYVELKTRLSELLLMRVDKMSMAWSIESRVPFLDHRLVEYSFRVPEAFKVHRGTGKHILKKIASQFLPDGIVWRKKTGLNSPVENWVDEGPVADVLQDAIASSSILNDAAIMNTGFVNDLVAGTNQTSSEKGRAKRMWTLAMFGLWESAYLKASPQKYTS